MDRHRLERPPRAEVRAAVSVSDPKGAPLSSVRTHRRAWSALPVVALAVAAMAIPAVGRREERPEDHGHDPQPVPRRRSVARDRRDEHRQAIDGAGVVWNELQSTKFAERAVPLAREIKRSKADLVGLQEVALWRKQTPSDGGAPPISPLPGATPATAVEQDFLAILRRSSSELGAKYKVVVVQEEFDAELPVDVDGSDATGTGPLAGSAPTSTRG